MPGRIIVDQQIVEDEWTDLPDEAPIPEAGKIIVGRDRWIGDAGLRGRGDVGVRYQSTENPFEDHSALEDVPLVALHFPAFTDGRPMTYARQLRQRGGFQGQIRATGDVLRDQIMYMWRCGFDAFVVRADKSVEDALAAFDEFSVDYQPTTPKRPGDLG